ncbi:hypothetical protein NLU13_7073 [Sarocladium strictum]|uniref:BZIP transcription factor n=1 Tax=Sarocladium strictum TaxID=5046 RepID=A0AA39GEK7_SARSR|nr:hypothetical protein NLU13_7073 [Sarocladium strictum]
MAPQGSRDDGPASPAGDSVTSRSKREASSAAGSPDSAAANKKLKKTGPGSRGVANLTPEQLAKKRANDREAQRAIRERTKNQIETLERRIHELTSQQPYQELQAALRAKELVEEENDHIKRQLASIVGMLQPIINSMGPTAAANLPTPAYAGQAQRRAKNTIPGSPWPDADGPGPDQAHLSPASHGGPASSAVHFQTQNMDSTPASSASPGGLEQSAPGGGWHPGASLPDGTARGQNPKQLGLEMGPERMGLGFLLDNNQHVARIPSGLDGPQDTKFYRHIPMKHDWKASPYDETLRPRAAAHSNGAWDGMSPDQAQQRHLPYHPQGASPSQSLPVDMPRYAMPVKNCGPTCPLDGILLDFLAERRQRAAEGLSVAQVVGPSYPSVTSLLNPANSSLSHPLSKVFTDILKTFPDLSGIPESVAVLYIMFLFMRWQISPTQENFERLPQWMHPTNEQIAIPHPAWVDHVPFPAMREKLCRNYDPDHYHFHTFFIPFTRTLRLSWLYEPHLTLLTTTEGNRPPETSINPVFEAHLRDLSNWKLGEAFAKTFPALADTYNMHNLPPHFSGTPPAAPGMSI